MKQPSVLHINDMILSSQVIKASGFTLVEVILTIVIMGILATIAFRTVGSVDTTVKTEETKHELDALAFAMAGNPELQNNGVRVDFGYIGDVGAMPPNLDALVSNPGGYITWRGPYFKPTFTQITDEHRKNAWGKQYIYTGSASITSPGDTVSGGGCGGPVVTGEIVRKVANTTSDLLLNQVRGTVLDSDGTPPGSVYKDSILVRLIIPDGLGSITSKTSNTDNGGYFSFDSIPIGNHDLEIIYLPNSDTLKRFVSVGPKSSVYSNYYFTDDIWQGEIPGLAAYWPLDETSGTTAYDLSGNGVNGVLTNMDPVTDWVTGKIGGALDFDGVDDYVNFGSSLSHTTNFTVAAWVNPASIGIDRQVISKGNNGTVTQWELKTSTSDGRVDFRKWDGGAVGVRSQQQLTTGTWYHLAGTYDGSTWKIYWNGILDSSFTAGGPVATSNNLYLGAVDANGSPIQFWHGLIDDVRIYNRVLNVSEIQALYNMGN